MIAYWHGRAVSENKRLAPGRGRFRANPDYQAFKESIAWTVRPHAEQMRGPVSVRLLLTLNPRMDAQNVIKPVLDALQLAGVIRDDRQVKALSFYRVNPPPKKEDSICIMVTEVPEEKVSDLLNEITGRKG